VLTDAHFDWEGDLPLKHPASDTVIGNVSARSDAAFEQISYEITTSCAENAIVNGFLHLLEQR